MSSWIYKNEYAVFKKGKKTERLFVLYHGVCTDPNCRCEGGMTYESNDDFENDKNDLCIRRF